MPQLTQQLAAVLRDESMKAKPKIRHRPANLLAVHMFVAYHKEILHELIALSHLLKHVRFVVRTRRAPRHQYVVVNDFATLCAAWLRTARSGVHTARCRQCQENPEAHTARRGQRPHHAAHGFAQHVVVSSTNNPKERAAHCGQRSHQAARHLATKLHAQGTHNTLSSVPTGAPKAHSTLWSAS